MLTLSHVCVRYGAHAALRDLSIHVAEGEWLMLVGPNGAGKSTALRAVTRGVPFEGEILVLGDDVRRLRAAELARRVGMLEQHSGAQYAYTVEEIVRLGRYAHARGPFSGGDAGGEEAVARSLETTGMAALRSKSALELSGGELQRAFLAQVFAQDPAILLLDEPANHLDLPYRRRAYTLIEEWLKRPGRAAVCVEHDLSLALRYGTRAALLCDGELIAQGEPKKALTRENLERAYGMDVRGFMLEMLGQWA